MALEFSMSSKENQIHGVKVLVYADSGIGKTMLCATAPKPIIISAENGLLSLNKRNLEKHWGVATPGITYDIPIIKIKSFDDLMAAYVFCNTPANMVNFETVCVDSITEIAESVLNNAKKTAKDPRQAYGVLIEQMENIVKAFRDLAGKNIYMTAKMEPHKDEFTGMTRFGPAMPGQKMGPKLPYLYDEVFKMGVNKHTDGTLYRFLLTQPDLQNNAKDRSGALDVMEMPHLTNVFNKIRQGV